MPLSGIGTSVNIIREGLEQNGFDVTVVITGNDSIKDMAFARQSGWCIEQPGLSVRYLPDRLKSLAEFYNAKNYDVIINNASPETQLILPCLHPSAIRIAVMRGLNASNLDLLAMHSDYLHAAVGISDEMTRVMANDPHIKAPVRLIPNCTTLKGGAFPGLHHPLKLCYIGRISNPDKNVLILPRIASLLKKGGIEFSLDIVGDGPARRRLEHNLKKLGLSGITFHGALSREQTHQIMSHSNFVLLPSFREGMSNVMLEGMATGCVPICSDIENFKWVLGNAARQLQCSLHQPEEYARRIAYLGSQPDAYQALQEYLRDRQQGLFKPEYTIQGYLDLIKELTSQNTRVLPPSCTFETIPIPRAYRLYCSPLWRVAQRTKDLFTGRQSSA